MSEITNSMGLSGHLIVQPDPTQASAARLAAIAEQIREEIGNFERNRAYPTSAPFVDRIAPIIAAALTEAEAPLLAQIDTLRQEQARLKAGRVPCKSCGKDDAAAESAQCYNCRNEPYRKLEEAEQQRDTALAALKTARNYIAFHGGAGDDWLAFVAHLDAALHPDTGRAKE